MPERIEFCILNIDYIMEGAQPVIRLWGKTEGGKNICVLDRTFDPYFYVEPKADLRKDDLENLKTRIMRLELDGEKPEKIDIMDRTMLGKSVQMLRITVKRPPDIPKYRDLLKDWKETRNEYEYGISFYRRYLIDKGLVPMSWAGATGEKDTKGDLIADVVINANKVEPLNREGLPRFNVMAFDIEMAEEMGEGKIIMISFRSSRGLNKVVTYKKVKGSGIELVDSEEGLLRRFVGVIREENPDILVGYNTDRFDFMKLDERCEKYRIDLNIGRDGRHVVFKRRGRISSAQINGRVHVDLFDFIEHILRSSLATETLTLDKVSKEILGKGKKRVKWKEIEQAWKDEKDLEKVVEYCRWDSELTLKMSDHLLPQIYELCKTIGQSLFDVSRMTYSQLVEWLLIKKTYEHGGVSQNRPRYDEVMRRRKYPAYTGSYVHIPKEGIHDNIALFDFASLYPTITITHNVSPETLNCICCRSDDPKKMRVHRVPDQEHYYCKKKPGFIPSIIKELLDKRSSVQRSMARTDSGSMKYKYLDNRQYALKILTNAIYGYYAFAGSRWYSRLCAESITAWGRFYIKKIISLAEKMKFDVIYGDTDSLFLKVRSRNQAKEFLKRANNSLPGVMELDFRELYRSGIFVLSKTGIAAKKRYALVDFDGKITIRGLEKVRRDWAKIAKDTQENVILAILKDRSPEKAAKMVKKTIGIIQGNKVEMDDLIIYSQVTRPLSKYEQISPHVVAARKARERGRVIKEGSTISFVITKGPGSISNRAEPAEDAENYDPDYYIHHQVIPAALRILSGLGYTEEDFSNGGNSGGKKAQSSLSRFVK
jgi:DNA polymerase I/DNA polymerase-2